VGGSIRLRLQVHGIAAGVAISMVVAMPSARAAEKLQQLGGAQIRAKLAGMELSDGVHSRDTFERNGTLTSHNMGRKTAGTWRVKGNELCLVPAKAEESCYVVWAAGAKVELRRKGADLPLIEGALRRPQ
jgi:hypothetical protein